MKILIVDDNEIFRDSVAVLLDFHGHKYEFAASGKEALEKVKKFQPKAIILDVMMPGMDGVEFAEPSNPTRNLSIFMS